VSPRPRPDRATATGVDDEFQALADRILAVVAALRRSGRRLGGRPAVLAERTTAELELVSTVRRHPGISVAEAAQELRLAPNTVSTLVRRLTEAEVLVREERADDRRVARLELAEGVRAQVESWRDRRMVAIADLLAARPPAERRRVTEALPVLEQVSKELAELGGGRP
jgi:DNA-binding MarR family transcriptional regulator